MGNLSKDTNEFIAEQKQTHRLKKKKKKTYGYQKEQVCRDGLEVWGW